MQTLSSQTARFASRTANTSSGFKLSDLLASVAFVAAIAFSIEQNVKLIIHGGYDAPECADLLKQHKNKAKKK